MARERLAALLGVGSEELAQAAKLSGKQAAALADRVAAELAEREARDLSIALALLGRAPPGLIARLVERHLSPRFVARVAPHLDPRTTGELVERLSDDYLAQVARWLDHERTTELLASIPAARIALVARALAHDEQFMTMAAVARQLPDVSLAAALEALEEDEVAAVLAYADKPLRNRASDRLPRKRRGRVAAG